MLEQDADGFSSYVGNQFTLDGFFGRQTYRPPSAALGRIATNHSDHALFMSAIEHLGGAGSLLFTQSAVQAGLLIAMAQPPNCLRGQLDDLGDLGCAGMLSQLQKGQGPQNDADLLDAALHQFPQFLLILLRDINLQSRTTHTRVWAKTILLKNGFWNLFRRSETWSVKTGASWWPAPIATAARANRPSTSDSDSPWSGWREDVNTGDERRNWDRRRIPPRSLARRRPSTPARDHAGARANRATPTIPIAAVRPRAQNQAVILPDVRDRRRILAAKCHRTPAKTGRRFGIATVRAA